MKKHLYLQAAAGLGLIAGLSGVEQLMHDTGVAKRFRSNTYVVACVVHDALVRGLEPAPPPVTIVDISAVPLTDDPITGEPYTPPDILAKVIRSITRLRPPAAIGVDLDLSPVLLADGGGHVPPGFSALMQLSDELSGAHIPVYFGVDRCVALGPQFWLKDQTWSGHAAWLRIPLGNEYMIPLRVTNPAWRSGSQSVELPSLAAAVAQHSPRNEEPHAFALSEEIVELPSAGTAAITPSDLSWIRYLPGTVIPCSSNGDIAQELLDRDRIQGKIVFLARVKSAADQLQPPGFERPLQGIYLHAAGAVTLMEQPLRVFNHHWGMSISLFVMLAGWVAHTAHLSHRRTRNPAQDILSAYRTNFLWAAFAVLLFVIFLFRHILWLELAMVLTFVALHTLAESYLVSSFARRRIRTHETVPPSSPPIHS